MSVALVVFGMVRSLPALGTQVAQAFVEYDIRRMGVEVLAGLGALRRILRQGWPGDEPLSYASLVCECERSAAIVISVAFEPY